ncbi:MAG: hypothetical protein IBJ00_06910, partial [Alphaproteobacteria bacterium]|nr:hypothetical protein [Alphaproteobacteria bacterium]
HKGEGADLISVQTMQGQPPRVGQHIALIRETDFITRKIQEKESMLSMQPAQKQALEEEKEANLSIIQTLSEEIAVLKKQVEGIATSMQTKQKELAGERENTNKHRDALGEISAELKMLAEQYELKEKEIRASLPKTDEQEGEIKSSLDHIEGSLSNASTSSEISTSEAPSTSGDSSLESHNYEENIEEDIPALTELRATYETDQKLLREKKDHNLALISSGEEREEKIKEELSNLEQEDEEYKQQSREKKNEIKKSKEEISLLTEKLERQQSEGEALKEDIENLKVEQQEKQDQADAYALIKYVTLLNIYSALPNDDFNYHEYTSNLSTLSFDIIPIICLLINDNCKTITAESVKEAIDRETSKFLRTIEVAFEDCFKPNSQLAQYRFMEAQFVGRNEQERKHMLDNFWTMLKRIGIQPEQFFAGYKKKQSYDFDPAPISDETFLKLTKDLLPSLRADHQVKKSMTKWRAKISTSEGSLVQRLALDSALFNPDYSLKTYPHLLSFSVIQQNIQGSGSDMTVLKDHTVWSLGQMQLKLNFAEALLSKDKTVLNRIAPIYRFIKSKSKIEGPSTLTARNLSSKKIEFEQLLKQNKDEAVRQAYFKYLSYMNMLYTLHYDGNGDEMPQLKIIDPSLEDHLKEPISSELRLDNVMAAKAYKWGQRVIEHGKKFIKENGLRAHTFSPLMEKKDKSIIK